MIELKGKYADAKIFASIIGDDTYTQIVKVINNEVAEGSKLAIMADCHSGSGCVIGTTMKIIDRVCPNLVGMDIGCGMLVVKLGKIEFDKETFARFDEAVRKVPAGFKVHDKINDEFWKELGDPNKFIQKFDCYKRLKDTNRLIKSLATLGGGNHFIELDKSSDGNVYLVIHTGSRNLGKQVCEYYQELAEGTVNRHREERWEIINRLKSEDRYQDINDELEKFEKSFVRVPNDLAYLTGADMDSYIHDLRLCQEFARENRKMIAYIILMNFFDLNKISRWKEEGFRYAAKKNSYFLNGMGVLESFETIHNYIDLDHMILRKGAVSAQLDEILLIPINMRDGSLICRGLGNEDYNYSAPHGAGRLMSRSKAKQEVELDDFVKSMEGIYTTSVNVSTIDESPFAYKPIEAILENIKDTVEVLEVIKPIYNFKASDNKGINDIE